MFWVSIRSAGFEALGESLKQENVAGFLGVDDGKIAGGIGLVACIGKV